MSEDTTIGVAHEAGSVLDDALAQLEDHAPQQTDGRWLEDLTADVAPHIRDWNVDGCWRWEDWPEPRRGDERGHSRHRCRDRPGGSPP